MNDRVQWWAICAGHEEIKRDAETYGLAPQWRALVEATRAGDAMLPDWADFLEAVEEIAETERNFISKGDALQRRTAALEALPGDYGCATGRCDQRAVLDRVGGPPMCALFGRPMAAP